MKRSLILGTPLPQPGPTNGPTLQPCCPWATKLPRGNQRGSLALERISSPKEKSRPQPSPLSSTRRQSGPDFRRRRHRHRVRCPHDGTPMYQAEIDLEKSGFRLWRCPQCDGRRTNEEGLVRSAPQEIHDVKRKNGVEP